MSQAFDDDHRLGTIADFPAILHARVSLVYDVTNETFQKSLINCLRLLQRSTRPIDLSLAGISGYVKGSVGFRVGVGCYDGFYVLDAKEEDRVLRRILSLGLFHTLDLSFDLHYRVLSSRRHRVASDRYLTRLTFQNSRAELLVHHLKGLKRIDPSEMVQLLVEVLNADLVSKGFEPISIEESQAN